MGRDARRRIEMYCMHERVPFVHSQVAALQERLAATIMVALVRLDTFVNLHVNDQVAAHSASEKKKRWDQQDKVSQTCNLTEKK